MSGAVVRVAGLTRRALEAHLAGLVALDAAVRARMGAAYSDEAWGEAAFRHELPGKWEASVVALRGGAPAGFWIASRRAPGLHYTHRVAVAPDARALGVGTRMFRAVVRRARAAGFAEMALSVAAENPAATRFYRRLGFAPLAGAEIGRVMGPAVELAEGGAAYRTASGQLNYVYLLQLTDPDA